MKIFFITFAFITALSLYPKIIPIFSSSESSVSTPKSTAFAQNNENVNKKTSSGNNVVSNNNKTPSKYRGSEYSGDTKSNPSISSQNPSVFKQNKENINKKTSSNDSSVQSNNKLPTRYKNGEYSGDIEDAYYGYVQVNVVVQRDNISNIRFLKYPNNNQNSAYLSSIALPILKQEVIQAQDGNVDMVSGATYTSRAFIQSANSAILEALN